MLTKAVCMFTSTSNFDYFEYIFFLFLPFGFYQIYPNPVLSDLLLIILSQIPNMNFSFCHSQQTFPLSFLPILFNPAPNVDTEFMSAPTYFLYSSPVVNRSPWMLVFLKHFAKSILSISVQSSSDIPKTFASCSNLISHAISNALLTPELRVYYPCLAFICCCQVLIAFCYYMYIDTNKLAV